MMIYILATNMEDSAAAHGRKALGISRMSAFRLLALLEMDEPIETGYMYHFWKDYKDGLKDYLWHLENEWKGRRCVSNKPPLAPPTGAALPPYMFHYPLICSFQIAHHKRYPDVEKESTFDVLMDEKLRDIYYPLGIYDFVHYGKLDEKEDELAVDHKHFLSPPRELINPKYCEAMLRSRLICGVLTYGGEFCGIHMKKRADPCMHMTGSGFMCKKSNMKDTDGCKDHKEYILYPFDDANGTLNRCNFSNANKVQCLRYVHPDNGDKCIFHKKKTECEVENCKRNALKVGRTCKRHKHVTVINDEIKEKYHVEGHKVVSVKYLGAGKTTVIYAVEECCDPEYSDTVPAVKSYVVKKSGCPFD
jgi:hypothetical protein